MDFSGKDSNEKMLATATAWSEASPQKVDVRKVASEPVEKKMKHVGQPEPAGGAVEDQPEVVPLAPRSRVVDVGDKRVHDGRRAQVAKVARRADADAERGARAHIEAGAAGALSSRNGYRGSFRIAAVTMGAYDGRRGYRWRR